MAPASRPHAARLPGGGPVAPQRGRAGYEEWAPPPELGAYVRAFFRFRDARTGSRGEPAICESLFADSGMSIVFDAASQWSTSSLWTPCRDRPRGYVVGPITRSVQTSLGGGVDAVGAYLKAGSGAKLLGAPPAALADQIVAVDAIWGAEGAALDDAIGAASDPASRVDLLARALLRRLRASTYTVDAGMIALAREAARTEPALSVARMAELAGLSRQHLTRRFRSAMGVAPRTFARLSRFSRLNEQVRAAGHRGWADLAAACGYADQSHLIAEYKEFAGAAPGALAASRAFHPFVAGAV